MTITPAARRAFYAPESDDDTVILLTISGPSIVTPIRLADNFTGRLASDDENVTHGLTSQSNPFVFAPMSVTIPGDKTREAPRATVAIENVDRSLVPLARNVDASMNVLIELVQKSTPNTVETSFSNLRFEEVNHDADRIDMVLGFENLARELFPARTITPEHFAACF